MTFFHILLPFFLRSFAPILFTLLPFHTRLHFSVSLLTSKFSNASLILCFMFTANKLLFWGSLYVFLRFCCLFWEFIFIKSFFPMRALRSQFLVCDWRKSFQIFHNFCIFRLQYINFFPFSSVRSIFSYFWWIQYFNQPLVLCDPYLSSDVVFIILRFHVSFILPSTLLLLQYSFNYSFY